MPTRNVVITDHQAALIENLVESGRYQNASEVLREGLRLVETRAKEDEAKLKALRAAIDVGIADLDRGDYVEFSDVKSMHEHLRALASDARKKVKRRGRLDRPIVVARPPRLFESDRGLGRAIRVSSVCNLRTEP
jgi:antitoxin ParD1/3/4